jgi:hypothetical protein
MGTRKVTSELAAMVDDGLLSWEQIARACLAYMTELDVADMAHSEELLDSEDSE